jgi:hypothetical protein
MEKDRPRVVVSDLDDLSDFFRTVVRTEIQACINENRFGNEFKDETWDRKTTAAFLKVSPEKITEMYKKKEIPGRKLGREYFFLRSQIEDLLKHRRA